MDVDAFDAITRRTAVGLPRRRSLLALGGAALAAALADPRPSVARKKKGADCKKKEKQRCAADVDRCRTTVLLNCSDPGGCFAAALCCEACTARGFLACAIADAAP